VDVLRSLKVARTGYIIMAVLFCALGVVLIMFPQMSMIAVCYLAGAMLIAYGIFKIIGYFSKDLYCLAFQFDFAFGLLTMVVGVIMIVRAEKIMPILVFILGIVILADSVFKIQTSLDARRFGLEAWWMILVMAVAAGVLGTLLILNPFGSAVAITIALGITLVLEGILNLCVVIYTVKIINKEKAGIVDADYVEVR